MAPKKRRVVGESSRQEEAAPRVVTTGTPRFKLDDDKDRYELLKTRMIVPTKFPDEEAMTIMGIHEHIRWLFQNIGLDWLLMTPLPTYQRATLEFLATIRHHVVDDEPNHPGIITFQMFNQERQWTLKDFNECYHFPTNGALGTHPDFNTQNFWKDITGLSTFNVKFAKSTAIQNPVFRYMHRVLSNTIFGRGESGGAVRVAELHLLWCMVYRQQPDLGHILWNSFLKHAHGEKGAIIFGGLLTPIARSISTNITAIPLPGPRTIDLSICLSMSLIKQFGNNRYQLVLKGKVPSLVLPHPLTDPRLQGNWLYASYNNGTERPPVHYEHIELDYYNNQQPIPEQQMGGNMNAPRLATMEFLAQRMDQICTTQEQHSNAIHQLMEHQQQLMAQSQSQQQMMETMFNWHISQNHFPPPHQ